jgi:hypothetical protein
MNIYSELGEATSPQCMICIMLLSPNYSPQNKLLKKTAYKANSKCCDELINVIINFLCSFLLDEVSCSFHYNCFLEQRYMALQSTLVYEITNARVVIGEIKITDDVFRRYIYLCVCPWCCQLPVSVEVYLHQVTKQ